MFLANITDETVLSQFESTLGALGRFDCLAPVPPRYLHITVKVVGNVAEKPASDAGITPEQEKRIIETMRSSFTDIEPFTVEFPRLNLFPTVVYTEVADDGRFSDLNRRIRDISAVPVWTRDEKGFIPHVTLGQFVHSEEYEQLIEYVETNRTTDIDSVEISAIELVALDLAERFPPFETVETFDLG